MDEKYQIIFENMPRAERLGLKYARQKSKDKDEMVAEAYYHLCCVVLEQDLSKVENIPSYLSKCIGRGLWLYSHNFIAAFRTANYQKAKGARPLEFENNKIQHKKSVKDVSFEDQENYCDPVARTELSEEQIYKIMYSLFTTGLERTIFDFYMKGWDDVQIAKELGRSKRLVRDIRNRIIHKVEEYIRKDNHADVSTIS